MGGARSANTFRKTHLMWSRRRKTGDSAFRTSGVVAKRLAVDRQPAYPLALCSVRCDGKIVLHRTSAPDLPEREAASNSAWVKATLAQSASSKFSSLLTLLPKGSVHRSERDDSVECMQFFSFYALWYNLCFNPCHRHLSLEARINYKWPLSL